MLASPAELARASLQGEASSSSMVDGIPIGTNEFDWGDWRPSRQRIESNSCWRWVVLGVVVLLHVLVIASVGVPGGSAPPLVASDAMEVTFVVDRVRVVPTPIGPASSESGRRDRPARHLDAPRSAPRQGSGEAWVVQPLRLELSEGTFDTAHFDAPNPLKRKPSSFDQPAETFMKDVRFGTLSPQQKLQKIGALFGVNTSDPCESARRRLANASASMDRSGLQEDLAAIERFCRR